MTTLTQMQTFTNARGRTFAVRLLPVGARYGRDNVLRVDKDTLVEFYDTASADDSTGRDGGCGPLGQFVSRYYAAVLLGRGRYSERTADQGLCLDGGNPEVWSIDPATMTAITAWIDKRYTIMVVDGTSWYVDYHPARRNGIIRPSDDATKQVRFETGGTSVFYPANKTTDPVAPATVLDPVLDRVSAWLRQRTT